uniref:hypothetical protein n=1 Tax=Endozoicomonas sp. SESOKO2 TaxID=2828743 RepID=UPI0021481864
GADDAGAVVGTSEVDTGTADETSDGDTELDEVRATDVLAQLCQFGKQTTSDNNSKDDFVQIVRLCRY